MLEFIVNPNSRCGRGRKIWKQIENRLKQEKREYRAHMTEKPRDAERIAAEITECREGERTPKTIVVLGGDGTLNEVVQGLSFGQPVTIGYIQCGSGNDFARGMGLEREPSRMLERILHPKGYRMVDYGLVTVPGEKGQSRRFVVSAGAGWDAAICHDLLDSRAKRFLNRISLGSLAYVAVGLKQWALARPVDGTLILDGYWKIPLKKMFFVSVHNLKYEGGGFMFGPGAEPSDGMLKLCVMSRMGRLKMVPAVLAAKAGKHGRFRGVDFYSCKKAELLLEEPRAVHADGESCGCPDRILFGCRKKKIRFIV